MEDPEPVAAHRLAEDEEGKEHDDDEEEEERQRQRAQEEMMERLLQMQEEEEEEDTDGVVGPGNHGNDVWGQDNVNDGVVGNNNNNNNPQQEDFQHVHFHEDVFVARQERKKPSYIQTSFLVAFGMIYYALRTRQQWYLALVYLSSSKWAYVVFGNAFVAGLMGMFQVLANTFLQGLRLQEAEGLGDFFRWNITETCLALTMFRNELNVQTGIWFLVLVLAKCLHWVADLREGHLRMTEEAVIANEQGWPAIRWPHLRLVLFLMLLQILDMTAVLYCAHDIMARGPSVSILFAFESAILFVSSMSNILLWNLHVLDGMFHYLHETTDPSRFIHQWIHPWKDHKATFLFAVEVQAQAAKFFFYVTFFAIVMTYYGMPINLFREVYMSFQALKSRLVAFGKYRQLMSKMNQFANPTAEELAEDENCIICRDVMTIPTTKRLPGCGHLFHKSCLREWLVQQQSCPTCRGDISAMEARERQQQAANQAQQQQQAQQEQEPPQQQQAQEEQPQAEQQQQQQQQQQPPQDEAKTQEQKEEGGGSSNKATKPSQPESTSSALKKDPPPPPSVILKNEVLPETTPSTTNPWGDQKPAAKEKRVQIVPPPGISSSFSRPQPQQQVDDPARFPAFYRVVRDQGASVYRYIKNNPNDDDDDETILLASLSSLLVDRIVPCGVILLGQGKTNSTMKIVQENEYMIRVPDGWVCASDVQRIMAVPTMTSSSSS